MTAAYALHIWASIFMVAATAVAGDSLTAHAMKRLGDLDAIRAKSGLGATILAVISEPTFVLGFMCMAVSFFSLLFALAPPAPVSLIAPATGSLTYVGNAIVARIFLHENVDKRRWVSAVLVCVGVWLISK